MSSVEDDRIREAQAALEAARALMLAPSVEAVDGSIPHLERAVACLDALQAVVRAGPVDAAARAGLLKLREAVRRVARLVENAAEFHLGWAQCAAVATAGYTAQGEPGQANCSGRLSVEG
jgi:hypothetical protein